MIINPKNTEHTLRVIPRFNPSTSLVINIKDTTTDLDEDISIESYAFTTTGGIEFDFGFEATDETRYQITIRQFKTIVYRGIMIATSQDTQDYQLTNDKYYF
tara:strand:- start:263 stop:568 length:306 start_codon:yes stop_codon:yes gene_type:complete